MSKYRSAKGGENMGHFRTILITDTSDDLPNILKDVDVNITNTMNLTAGTHGEEISDMAYETLEDKSKCVFTLKNKADKLNSKMWDRRVNVMLSDEKEQIQIKDCYLKKVNNNIEVQMRSSDSIFPRR